MAKKKDLKGRVKERRRYQRLELPIRVKYEVSRKKKPRKEAVTKDISGGGFKLRLDAPLDKRKTLKAYLYFPAGGRPVSARSRVMWTKKVRRGGNHMYDNGIGHVSIDRKDRQRFVFLFCETMLNYFMEK